MVSMARAKHIVIFATNDGREPFYQWLNALRDIKGRQRIQTRLRRLEQGLLGDCQSLGNGVFELRLFFGPGYRVYFGEDDDDLVILLCGGDKSSQNSDIKTAKQYWQEYSNHD